MNAAECKRIQAENDPFAADYEFCFLDYPSLMAAIGERNGLLIERTCGNRPLHIKVCGCGPAADFVWAAGRGRKIVMSDISTCMLDQARPRFANPQFDVALHQANILDLSEFTQAEFDAATFLGNSIAYIRAESDFFQGIKQARSLLSEGGHLFVGFRDYTQWLTNAKPGECATDGVFRCIEADGFRIVFQLWEYIGEGLYSSTVHIHRHTSFEKSCHAHHMALLRAWTKDEVGTLLKAAGFRVTFEVLTHRSIALDGFDQLMAIASLQ